MAAGVTVLASAVAAFMVWKGQRDYDPAFDAQVTEPAYKAGGPLVLYDEGHLNTHAASGAYKPLAGLIRSDGYELRVSREVFSEKTLAGVAVLIVALPRGANDANDQPAFAVSEMAAVAQWVRQGGSLLLVTDHWPYGPAAAPLAQRFDVQMGQGLVEDASHHDPSRGNSHLVFSEDNGLLKDHPVIRGRTPAERVRKVLTFTGQSLLGPPSAVPFLALSDAAVELPPTAPKVEKTGGDVRVTMDYGAPISAKGRAQGIALEVGRGRLVILGEAGMLRAQKERGGERVGMNVPGYDDRQLAINIMHWLSRLL
jgi:hypothetical protein